jgi:branched-chain amino acid transport system substrate-binding protein
MRLIAVAALAAFAGGAAAEPVKVGMITTLSGGGAGLGIDVRDGFELALERAEGHEIELVVEDDQQKPDIAVQLSDRMVQSEDVDVMTGIIFSNLALAVVPGAVRQGIFYLSPNAGPSALAGEGCHENYFNVAWQNDNLHEAAGAYANEAGYAEVFVMAPNYPAGQDALTGFKRMYEGGIAGEIYTQLGQTDYAAEIAQIRAAGPDAVFFFLPGGMGISFVKQYDQSGLEVPLIGPAFSFSQDILAAVGPAALGVRNTSQWSQDLDNAANEAFVEAFQAAYGRLPSLYASQGYDTANLLLSALETAHPDEPEAFRAALRAAEFGSVRGDFAFGPNQHPVQDLYVREVVERDGVLTNVIVGTALEDHADAYAGQCSM